MALVKISLAELTDSEHIVICKIFFMSIYLSVVINVSKCRRKKEEILCIFFALFSWILR